MMDPKTKKKKTFALQHRYTHSHHNNACAVRDAFALSGRQITLDSKTSEHFKLKPTFI